MSTDTTDITQEKKKRDMNHIKYIHRIIKSIRKAIPSLNINKARILAGKVYKDIKNNKLSETEAIENSIKIHKKAVISARKMKLTNPKKTFQELYYVADKEVMKKKKNKKIIHISESEPIIIMSDKTKKSGTSLLWNNIIDIGRDIKEPKHGYPLTETTFEYMSQFSFNYIHKLKALYDKRLPQGYIMKIKLIFDRGDKLEDGFNGRKTSNKIYSAVFNKDATQDIIAIKLGSMTNAHYDTTDYILHLKSIWTRITGLSKKGGCLDNCKYKSENILYDSFKRIDIKSFKSTNNNCMIQCFNKAFGIAGNIIKPDYVREQLGIEKGILLLYTLAPVICEWYNKQDWSKLGGNFKNNTKGVIVINEELNIISTYGDINPDNCVQLYLRKNHYYIFETKTYLNCEYCGQYINVNKKEEHTCNITKISFKQRKLNKLRNMVKVSSIKDAKILDYNDLICWDLETFQSKDSSQHVAYASGWYDANTATKYNVKYGKDCIDKTINEFITYKNKIITAYNGSGFDFYFLIDKLNKLNIPIKNMILCHGKIMSFTFGDNNKVFDLYLFLTSSLDKACKDFKIENAKGSFNHKLIQTWEDTETHKKEILPYLRLDVLGLRELFIKFNDMMYNRFSANITNYVTASHMAYEIWSSMLKEIVEIPNDIEKYEFISKAIFGGRCYPHQKEYASKLYNTLNPHSYDDCNFENQFGLLCYNMLYESNDFIFNADVSSLYPASMAGTDRFKVEYPIGASRWSDNPKVEFEADKIGFYQISYIPPKDIRIPILPRRKLRKDVNIGVSWSLEDGIGTYTSVDIKNAIDVGYKVTFYGKCLVYDKKGDLFSQYIGIFFDMKKEAEKEKNPVLRSTAKLFLNALYGKTLQGAIFDTTAIFNNVDDYNTFCIEHVVTDWVNLDEDGCRVLVSGTVKDVDKPSKITKPRQLGAFVTAYSRMIMLFYMKAVDPTLKSTIFTYTDTDSLHIKGVDYKKLKALGYIKSKDEAQLGDLTNDIDDEGLIYYEKNLAPKSYNYEYINDNGQIFDNKKSVIKMKGIGKKYLTKEMFDIEKPHVVKTEGLKKKNKKLNSKDVENGIDYFSVINYEQDKTFYKTQFAPERFINNEWFPVSYKI